MLRTSKAKGQEHGGWVEASFEVYFFLTFSTKYGYAACLVVVGLVAQQDHSTLPNISRLSSFLVIAVCFPPTHCSVLWGLASIVSASSDSSPNPVTVFSYYRCLFACSDFSLLCSLIVATFSFLLPGLALLFNSILVDDTKTSRVVFLNSFCFVG